MMSDSPQFKRLAQVLRERAELKEALAECLQVFDHMFAHDTRSASFEHAREVLARMDGDGK